jgi:uncharacterized protein with PQ loop repeat
VQFTALSDKLANMENQAEIAVIVGWIATGLGVAMWLTLIDQIKLNLKGAKGSWIVACAIVLNCVAWVSYGFLSEPHIWPVIAANLPGIVLGAVAAYTSFPFVKKK